MADIPIDDTYVGDSDDSDGGGATARTLASTVNSYRFENGRRYHSYREGQYWGPNDDLNADHESIFHHLFCQTLGDRLHLAPLSEPGVVLDIGTGTGKWAIDFADQNEECSVIATDLSPIWPRDTGSLPNLRFEIDDCCAEWTYPPESFDFVHMRALYGSVADWPALYKECFDHMVPGGYIEQAEIGLIPHSDDDSLERGGAFQRWTQFGIECSRRTGKPLLIFETMRQSIADAGFVDVVEHRFKWPVGMWSSDEHFRELGRWYREFWLHGMEGWMMAMGTRVLNWSPEYVRSFVEETRRALDDRSQHVWYEAVVVYGRKPL